MGPHSIGPPELVLPEIWSYYDREADALYLNFQKAEPGGR